MAMATATATVMAATTGTATATATGPTVVRMKCKSLEVFEGGDDGEVISAAELTQSRTR